MRYQIAATWGRRYFDCIIYLSPSIGTTVGKTPIQYVPEEPFIRLLAYPIANV